MLILRTLLLSAGFALASEATAQTPPAPPVHSPEAPESAAQVPDGSVERPARRPGTSTYFETDPWETVNRDLYALHNGLDRILFRPVAMAYTHVVPKPVRTGLRNAFDNIGEVRVFANDMLQFRPKQAGWTLLRFATNTTFGVAGLFDVATGAGVPHHDNDFGLTLGRMDVEPGPYLFLPLMGPTTVRDLTGSVVDLAFNPLTWGDGDAVEAAQITGGITKGLDLRARVDDDLRSFRELSLEPYAAMRSAYLQNRRAEVVGGELSIEELPEFPELEGGPQEPPEQAAPPTEFPELDGGPQAPPVATPAPEMQQQGGARR